MYYIIHLKLKLPIIIKKYSPPNTNTTDKHEFIGFNTQNE